ncbi:MAG TPA: TRAP transporter TatT component family protein [Planctomycetota bacterium]|nr:TRAP transporter TatT component family protein [Planctomycetota bacterium]HRR80204.1 TRAP transporter TatT component family protein [Planctomycetota bacterium]HRT93204.1 TRAP transporter TatT component family protein [Planctomycetota bacterium]
MPSPWRRAQLVAALAGLSAVTACRTLPRPARQVATASASEHDADWHWARREEATHLRTALALYRQQFDRAPSVTLCHRVCRASFLLADYFLEDDPAAQDTVFAEAAHVALGALRLQPDVAATLGDRADLTTAAIARVDAEHGSALIWWVAHFGRWLAHRDLVTQLVHMGRLLAAMDRATTLHAEIAPGSIDRMWGAYYARRRNFAKARLHLDQAVRLAPHILYTRILYATDYAIPARDKETFIAQLRLALAEREPADPEWAADFRLERERAKRLLAKADALFPK